MSGDNGSGDDSDKQDRDVPEELTEAQVRRVEWGKKILAGTMLFIAFIVIISSLGSLPSDTVDFPVNNTTIEPPEDNQTISIVSTNASVESFNESGVVTIRTSTNQTYSEPMSWVDTVGRDLERSRLNVSSACYDRVATESDAYVESNIVGERAFVAGYGPNASDSLELFVGENGTSVSGKLLLRGYAVPSPAASAAYNQTAVNAQERENGIWECVPEDDEPAYNTTET